MAWTGDTWPFAFAKDSDSHQWLLHIAVVGPFLPVAVNSEKWRLASDLAAGGGVPRGCAMPGPLPFVPGPPSVLPSWALSWGVFVCLMSL